MASLADHLDEGAALARLLDPVALEARLADARARRAVALAGQPAGAGHVLRRPLRCRSPGPR